MAVKSDNLANTCESRFTSTVRTKRTRFYPPMKSENKADHGAGIKANEKRGNRLQPQMHSNYIKEIGIVLDGPDTHYWTRTRPYNKKRFTMIILLDLVLNLLDEILFGAELTFNMAILMFIPFAVSVARERRVTEYHERNHTKYKTQYNGVR